MSRLFKNLTTAAGSVVKKIAGPEPEPQKNAPQAQPGPDPGPVIEVLLAWKASAKNPQLVTAYRAGTDPTNPNNLVSVHVRSNLNFIPHMRMKVSRVTGRDNEFNLVGPLPRWRGKY